LIHAGDLTQSGSLSELQKTLDWLNTFPHTHKVVVAGNHDLFLDKTTAAADHDALNWGSLIYLQDSSTSLTFPGGRTLKVYGSPWTRKQGNWAFQYPRGEDRWSNTIPDDTDVLVTHSPPRFYLDLDGFGDENLLNELWRVRPRVHVFGHIHAGYGQDVLVFDKLQEVYERILKVQTLWALVWMLLLLLYSMVAGQTRRHDESSNHLCNKALLQGSMSQAALIGPHQAVSGKDCQISDSNSPALHERGPSTALQCSYALKHFPQRHLHCPLVAQ